MSVSPIFKDYILLWAMGIGAIISPWGWHLSGVLPLLVFIMLGLSYTKVRPSDLKINRSHIILIGCQWLLGLLSYFILRQWDPLLAQGVALIILTPTATAAAVVTGMLGGRMGFVTANLLLSNILVVAIAPILLSAVYPDASIPYTELMVTILSKVALLLIVPLLLAWYLRYRRPTAHQWLQKHSNTTLYFWCLALIIITSNTIHFFITHKSLNLRYGIILAIASLLTCLILFGLGQYVGSKTLREKITCGQALGQKNTILSIWIALAFMNPIVSILPSFYVIWQNIVNALELSQQSRHERSQHR